jgi:phospholipid-binding lipoprotein MlaA
VIDTRAQFLDAERVISGDRYTFIRDAYLQRREFDVNDGQVEFKSSDF